QDFFALVLSNHDGRRRAGPSHRSAGASLEFVREYRRPPAVERRRAAEQRTRASATTESTQGEGSLAIDLNRYSTARGLRIEDRGSRMAFLHARRYSILDLQSSILDPRSSILNPRSSTLDP